MSNFIPVFFRTDLSFHGWKHEPILKPAIVFWGRSNVGKSSLINRFTNRKKLAYTSKRPGKTQAIHFYEILIWNCYLVDLPGYGYTKIARKTTNAFTRLTVDFLTSSIAKFIFVLIDSKISWQELDLMVFKQLKQWKISFGIILNKVDRINSNLKKQKISEALKWTSHVLCFSATAKTSVYVDDLRIFIKKQI